MRKAFTLVEVLVLVTIAPLLMVVVSGIFATFIRDVPRETRVVQENTTVLDMLQQVRRDMDGAAGLLEQFNGTTAGERTLLIGDSDAVICYRFEDGRTVRTLLKGQEASNPGGQRIWRMPNAVITWRPWMRDGRACAVEMHSHLQQQIAGTLITKLANSQVFFVHSLSGKGREVR
jgi:type II secretory pathway pseudopilin PulG